MDNLDKAIKEVREVREHQEAMAASKAATDAAMHDKLIGIACSDPRRACECLYAAFLRRRFIAIGMLGGEPFDVPAGIEHIEAINIINDTIKRALFL